jgi:hypothetical protein
MRRIALVLALVLGAVLATGCMWNWRDPMHPQAFPAAR